MNVKKCVPSLSIICLSAYILTMPGSAAQYAKQGIDTCLNTIVPYLFPYLVLSGAFSLSPVRNAVIKILAPVTVRLFRLPESLSAGVLLGLISGFPVSSVSAFCAYRNRECTEEQLSFAAAVLSAPSPSFVIAVGGGAVMGDLRYGAALYLLQLVSILLSALLLRPKEPPAPCKPNPASSSAALLTRAMKQSVQSMALICGYVIFFSFCQGFVLTVLPVGDNPALRSLIAGIFEIGSGSASLIGMTSRAKQYLLSFFLGFGGLSAFFQVKSVCGGLPDTRQYFTARMIGVSVLIFGSFLFKTCIFR